MKRAMYLVMCVAGLIPFPGRAAPKRPDKYPEVILDAKSEARYTAVALDTTGSQAAYLLFDGNVNKGYDRVYVWIPGDPKYDKPLSKKSGEQKQFSPFGINTKSDKTKEDVTINWQMAWYIHGGRHDYWDYKVGKMVKRDVGKYPRFPFNVHVLRKPSRAMAKPGTESVDIVIPGEIPTSTTWTNCPAPLAPWNKLRFDITTKREKAKEQDKGRFRFLGRLLYWHWRECTVRSMPPETDITLMVSPYLEPPIYSNKLTAVDMFHKGITLEFPYGWYDVDWSIKCSGLKVRTRKEWRRKMYSPYPFSRTGGDM